MSIYTYKTKDGTTTGFVPGVGQIVDGKITSNAPIESPNLVQVLSPDDDAKVTPPAPIEGTASQVNPNLPNGVQE